MHCIVAKRRPRKENQSAGVRFPTARVAQAHSALVQGPTPSPESDITELSDSNPLPQDHSYSSFTATSLVLVETLPGENAIGHFGALHSLGAIPPAGSQPSEESRSTPV